MISCYCSVPSLIWTAWTTTLPTTCSTVSHLSLSLMEASPPSVPCLNPMVPPHCRDLTLLLPPAETPPSPEETSCSRLSTTHCRPDPQHLQSPAQEQPRLILHPPANQVKKQTESHWYHNNRSWTSTARLYWWKRLKILIRIFQEEEKWWWVCCLEFCFCLL